VRRLPCVSKCRPRQHQRDLAMGLSRPPSPIMRPQQVERKNRRFRWWYRATQSVVPSKPAPATNQPQGRSSGRDDSSAGERSNPATSRFPLRALGGCPRPQEEKSQAGDSISASAASNAARLNRASRYARKRMRSRLQIELPVVAARILASLQPRFLPFSLRRSRRRSG